jgi:hypothetical protein
MLPKGSNLASIDWYQKHTSKSCETIPLKSYIDLDLTLNFIGDIESVASLKENTKLETLFLTGLMHTFTLS